MKIKWLRVVRDVAIVTVFFGIGGFIVGYATQGQWTKDALFIAASMLGILGFCLCGCLTIENRWKHLFIVALGVWLINCLPLLPTLPFSVLAWVLNVSVIFFPMVIGGSISSVLARASKQKECRVDEPEKAEND